MLKRRSKGLKIKSPSDPKLWPVKPPPINEIQPKDLPNPSLRSWPTTTSWYACLHAPRTILIQGIGCPVHTLNPINPSQSARPSSKGIDRIIFQCPRAQEESHSAQLDSVGRQKCCFVSSWRFKQLNTQAFLRNCRRWVNSQMQIPQGASTGTPKHKTYIP